MRGSAAVGAVGDYVHASTSKEVHGELVHSEFVAEDLGAIFMAARERWEANSPHERTGRSVQPVEQNRQGVWEWAGGVGGGLGRMAQCYGSGDDGEESAVWSPYGNHTQVCSRVARLLWGPAGCVVLCVDVLLGVANVFLYVANVLPRVANV